ncbi:MAG: DMT family transporter [Oscillospiraceae bacterium]|nr:DMT family transporter [Oscillospiraceae bacterium]
MEKTSSLSKPVIATVCALICCLLWGSAFPAIKVGFAQLDISADDIASEILYAGLRFTLAGLFTIIISSIISKKFLYPSVKALPKVFGLSLFQTVIQYFFFYVGLANTTGVKGSVVNATTVFASLIVSCLIFKMEKFTAAKIAGCVIGFAGVVIVNLTDGFDLAFTLKGEGFIFIAAFAYAFSTVLIKRWSTCENPMMLSGWQFLAGGLVMTVCSFLAGGRLNGFGLDNLPLLLYLALLSAVAYSLWAVLLKHNPVSRITVFCFTNPIFGVILSALILKETQAFGTKSLIALVLVCVGIFIVNRDKKTTVSAD